MCADRPRKTGTKTDRQTDRERERQTKRERHIQTETEAHRQTDIEAKTEIPIHISAVPKERAPAERCLMAGPRFLLELSCGLFKATA